MIETENKKRTNFLLNMKIFHNLKIKTYPHKTLNSSIGVIRNKELSKCSREEILAELKKPRWNWYKKNYHQKRKPNNTNKHLYINHHLTYNSERNKNQLH